MNLKALFSQLRPWMGVKMLCFTASNRILNPYGHVFFGFSAEDQVIQTLLGYPEMGYYVDVGCNQPVRFSNTFAFYLRGWKGLTIDANFRLVELHRRVRPRDTSICCAVSDTEKTVVFTECQEDLLSSISAESATESRSEVPIASQKKMRTRSLNSIFMEHSVPTEFDFLSIDVEGYDYEVLLGINLAEYRPRMIVIEMKGFRFENLQSDPICTYLKENGYMLVAFYHINGFFMREDLTPGG